MEADEFRRRVYEAFGPRLDRATPDNVREFVVQFESGSAVIPTQSGRYLLEGEPNETIEGGLKAFLNEALEVDPETARQHLWVALLDLWYGIIEIEDAALFSRLFDDIPPPDPAP